jgi:Domain of unknown function (DUF6985)
MASDRVHYLKTLLDQLASQAEAGEQATTAEQALRSQAISGFIAGGAQLLDQATPYLRAYYQRTADEFTAEERALYGIPDIPDSADIWEHVQFPHPAQCRPGGGPLSPGRSYLSFEGEVSWEPEHGLQLVYEDGQRLCKVSPYDGHLTLAHAYGDPSLLGVVFG